MAENLPHHTPGTVPMAAVDWDGEMPVRMRALFPALVFKSYLDQHWVECVPADVLAVIEHLLNHERFDMLVDLTAVHWPTAPEPFEVVYILYSFASNSRIRVKTRCAGEVPSIVPLFAGADWMEREAYDMFGVRFSGHQDLKRILLPEDWHGFPLLKEKSIVDMDNNWVQRNLGIESGQS